MTLTPIRTGSESRIRRSAKRASISGPDPAPPRVPSLACGGGSGWGSPGQDSCPHRSLPHGGRASGTAGAPYLPPAFNHPLPLQMVVSDGLGVHIFTPAFVAV